MAPPSTSLDDDEFLCSSHKSHVVALFCQSCEELICPRCISQGASGSGAHRQHVYLDLMDAYDLKKEEFNKVLTNFRDTTQTRKNERAELHSTIQKLKLELLRKKTEATKQTKTLRDTITRHEKQYVRLLENIIEPAIVRSELTYQGLDFEVVSRDGLIGGAECTQMISSEKCIQFLRRQCKNERDIVNLSAKSESLPEDPLTELSTLKRVDLNLHRERSMIRSTFSCPSSPPPQPRFVRSWCTIGQNSASVVVKCSRKVPVSHYVVHCHPFTSKQVKEYNLDIPSKSCPKSEKGCIVFKLRKFTVGRHHVTLRSLRPGATYRVEVFAVNLCGSSQPAICYFSTPCVQKVARVFFDKPQVPKCRLFWNVLLFLVRVVLLLSLGVLTAWALFGMYVSLDIVLLKISVACSEICDLAFHQNITMLNYFYEKVCPRKISHIIEVNDRDVAFDSNIDHDHNFVHRSSFHEIWDWFLSLIDQN